MMHPYDGLGFLRAKGIAAGGAENEAPPRTHKFCTHMHSFLSVHSVFIVSVS